MNNAFTLIELLTVIGVIAILAAAIIVAVSPGEILAEARDSARDNHVRSLEQAVYTYQVTEGSLPSGITASAKEICNSGSDTEPVCPSEMIDLSGLVTTYLSSIPIDPNRDEEDDGTGYLISINPNTDRLYVEAVESETRLVSTGSPGATASLTFSGDLITDPIRASNIEGDGRTPEESVGIWRGTTNLVENGGFETDSSGWISTDATLSRTTSEAKFGDASAQVATDGTSLSEWLTSSTVITVPTESDVTGSAWIHAPVGASLILKLWAYEDGSWNGGNSTVLTGNGDWQLVTVSREMSVTENGVRVVVQVIDEPQDITFYVDGVQLEQLPTATPYVETDGATASRADARVQAPVTVIDEEQAWVAARVRRGFLDITYGSQSGYFTWSGSGGQWLTLKHRAAASNVSYDDGATVHRLVIANEEPDVGEVFTIVGGWTGGDTLYGSYNGGPLQSLLAEPIDIDGSHFDIGRSWFNNRPTDSDFFWFATGTGTLTDADAATLDGFGNNAPTLSQLQSSMPDSKPTMVWPGVDETIFTSDE